MALPPARAELRRAAWELARNASAELARLRRIRGPGRRTARRISRARARLALAAALLAPALGGPAWARTPIFVNLLEPWGLRDVGGHSTPTFADIDADGDLDAFVGETAGKTIFFRNQGTASAPAFATPQTNPFGLLDFGDFSAPAFADLDDDGDLDLFQGDAQGGMVFQLNTGSASSPAFVIASVTTFDVGFDADPTFADLDGDGDLDLFAGEGAYGNTFFFENTGTASDASFVPAGSNPFGLAKLSGEASPRFADLDGDGDLDGLFGEAGGNLVFFENTGTASAPAFAAPVTNPFGFADVGDLAAPAFADLDGDSDLDVFVGGFPGRSVLFANTGTASAPAFFRPIELPLGGLYSAPTFVDIDGDGDLDLFVGGYLEDEQEFGVWFLANVGSASAPSFAEPQGSFGLSPFPGDVPTPAFADLDVDGDFDALVGESSGETNFLENTGSGSSPAFAAPVTNLFADVGFYASPALADLDGDGDLDAFMGEYYGDTLFSENTGSASAAAFATFATNPFGLIGVGIFASPSFADADNDGDLDVFLGGLDGNTIFLTNAGTPTGALFVAPVTNPFGLADVGSLSRPALGDVDGDGDLDALIGAIGSTTFFLNLAPLCPAAPDPGCAAFAAGSLSVDERKPGREKLTARLSKGPELAQGAFGDPTGASGTTVALCLYDDAGAPVTRLVVDRGGESCGSKPCWKPVGKAPPEGKGFVYKDPSRSADGMAALKLQGGAAGRSSVALSASNKAAKGANALPTDIAAELATATEVTLQVHTSDARCFGATLSEVIQQDGERFKAK